LVKGAGRFAADWSYPGQLHAVFLRADRAHAEIRSINVEAARNHPGVVAVLTHEDVTKAGFGPMAVNISPKHRDGRPVWKPHSPVLAHGRVRYVGELMACVVAQTPETAMDALELIEVDYDNLPAVIDPAAALDSGAPIIHPEVAGNVALDWEIGDEARTREAFTNARHIVTLRVYNNRVIAQPMEPRACLAIHDQVNDVTTLHCPSQGVHNQLGLLSAATRLPPEKLSIVVRDVGGGFGARSAAYPEYVNVVLAARLLKRPVKWLGTRSEVFLNDFHGRDCVQTGELALDENLKFLGMRFDFIQALGAYSGPNGAFPATGSATNCLTGEYDVPTAYHRTRIAFTNTAPTAAYRGSGRPLMSYIIERLVDQAAIELKIDPVELRRRNLVPNGKMPYKQVHGVTYDCGDFHAVLERALKKADWDGFEKRLAESAKRGKLRGRGIATFIEASGGGRGGEDNVLVRFDVDGKISLYAGAQAGGQSHETTFAQIVSEATGLPLERFVVRSGDGTRIAGSGAGGSRTMVGSGSMFHVAALKVVEKGKELAVYALEAPEPDIEFNQGEYRIKGSDRRIGISDLIERYRSHSPHPLTTTEKGFFGMTFPNSCHICEVEVDPETGAIEILKYSGVDDAGRVINHQVVEGQMHGGIMQGTGQVLLEHAYYDRDTGQLMTGTFMDYAMPRASNRVPVELEDLPTYTKTNPLGVKGVGECGVTGALATVMNAVMDAMRRGGVTHFDMPCTPQRVWAALQAAKAGDPRALSVDKNLA
jgi:carbon-monoxide dehydrogenase large subunit